MDNQKQRKGRDALGKKKRKLWLYVNQFNMAGFMTTLLYLVYAMELSQLTHREKRAKKRSEKI